MQTVQRIRASFRKQTEQNPNKFEIPKRKPGQGRPKSTRAGVMAKMRRIFIQSPRIMTKKAQIQDR